MAGTALQIDMFGGLQVRAGEQVLVEHGARMNKPLELLVILVLNRQAKISNEQLMDALWEEGEIENPAGALKTAVYSLRKMFQAACPGINFIITRERQYCWNNEMALELDVDQFSELHRQVKGGGVPDDALLGYCRRALALYTGDFLPGLGDRHWVIPFSGTLRQQYLDLVCQASDILLARHARETAEEAMDLCNRAVLTEPLDEGLYVRLFSAMQQLNMKTAVLKYYPVVANRFFDELGEPLPARLRAIYQWASESSNQTMDDILHIQRDLDETTRDAKPIRGAYFCQYEVFKHMFHMVVRSAVRSNNCVLLFLVTLQPTHGQAVPKEDMVRTMLALKEQIQGVLRKGDVYSRYSRNQYVLMLSMRSEEDCEVVKQRLREAYLKANPPKFLQLDITTGKPDTIV